MRQIPSLSELRPRAAVARVVVHSIWARHRAKVWIVGLVALVPATSWAVATVSLWLVPPYLLVIGFVLFAPGGPSDEEHEPSILVGPHAAVGPSSDGLEDPSEDDFGSDGESSNAPDSEAAGAAGSGKTRKTKRRAKRVPLPQAEPPKEATWVQVGPGKFVRVEAPAGSVESTPNAEASEESRPNPADEPSVRVEEDSAASALDTQPLDDDFRDPIESTDLVTPVEDADDSEEMTEDHSTEEDPEAQIESAVEDMAEDHGIAPEASDEATDHGIAPEALAGMPEPTVEIEPYGDPEEEPDSSVFDPETDDAFDDSDTTSVEEDRAATAFPASRMSSNVDLSAKYTPRLNLRSSRSNPLPAGFRRRSPRGLGRQRSEGRHLSIRSPPRRMCRTQ